MSGQHIELPKLSKASYQRWKYEVESALKCCELYEVAVGTEECPATSEENAAKIKTWRVHDAKAMRVLTSGLSDEDHAAIRDCKSAKAIYDKITGLYEQKTATNKYLMSQEFHRYKFESGQSVASYCAGLAIIGQKLEAAGDKMPSATMVAKLINDLPSSYDTFRQTYYIQAASGTSLSFEQIQAQLSMIEINAGLTVKTEDTGEAFMAKRKPGAANKYFNKKKESRECFYCKKIGHIKPNCRKFKADQERGVAGGQQYENGSGFMASECFGHGGQTWIADSGASSYMVADKGMFCDLKALSTPIPITIGNGRVIQAMGRGEIDAKVFDGVTWCDRKLFDVLWVPEISHSLFSLSAMTKKGFEVKMANDTLRVMSGQKTFMVGKRGPQSLFYVGLRVPSETAYKASGSLQAWHERLGHVSVDTIKAMAKDGTVDGLVIDSTDEFFCSGCALGKMTKKPYKTATAKNVGVGERIHSDVCGPMEVASIVNYIIRNSAMAVFDTNIVYTVNFS